MRKITKDQIKIIHVLKNILALDDSQYRGGLYVACGVRSSKDLSFEQANGVIMGMKRMAGQENLDIEQRTKFSKRTGFATVQQIDYISGLWKKVSLYHDDNARERALRAFVDRVAHVSDLRFLTSRGAAAVIAALKSMEKRKDEKELRTDAARFAAGLV